MKPIYDKTIAQRDQLLVRDHVLLYESGKGDHVMWYESGEMCFLSGSVTRCIQMRNRGDRVLSFGSGGKAYTSNIWRMMGLYVYNA